MDAENIITVIDIIVDTVDKIIDILA